MCWNARVSLATFISSLIMCAYLWSRHLTNDKPLAIFIGWFACMQLFECFMWRNMKNHTFVAKIALIFILLQPLSLVAGLYYYSGALYQYWEKIVLGLIALVSGIKGLAALIYAFFIDTQRQWLSVKGPHCHLVWWFFEHFNSLPRIVTGDIVYFLALFLALLMVRPLYRGLLYGCFALLTLGLTRTFYPTEYGSLWCWVVNLFALFVILEPHLHHALIQHH